MEKYAEQISRLNELRSKYGITDMSFKKNKGHFVDYLGHKHNMEYLHVKMDFKKKDGYMNIVEFPLVNNTDKEIDSVEASIK